MKLVSGLLRLICGLVLIIFAFATYHRIGAQVAAGQPIQIAGITIGASASQLNLGLIIVGLIGVFLMILGVVTFLRKPEVVRELEKGAEVSVSRWLLLSAGGRAVPE